MRDPFDYQLDLLADDLIQESADAKRSQRGWYVTLALIVLAALGILWAIHSWNVKTAQSNLGGEEGVLYDGVYYIYAGSGFPLPNEVKVPRGIFAYTPGEEPELLVSTRDYALNTLFPCWDVNGQGLYFVDGWDNTLWCMDLDTREVRQIYELPKAHDPLEETEDMTWKQVLSGEYREAHQASADYNPCMFVQYLDEERIILLCSDGVEDFFLTLDCRTGEVLDKQTEEPPELTEPQEGTLAYEARRLGLPEGSVETEEGEAYYWSVALADKWLFYGKEWPNEDPRIADYQFQFLAMDVDTGESYLVSEEVKPHIAVTDGVWFYTCGDATDCYKLEYTPEGIPCGLTLVENDI